VDLVKPFHWFSGKLESRPRGGCDQGVFAREAVARGERLAIFGGRVTTIAEDRLYQDQGLDYSLQVDVGHVIGISCTEESDDAEHFNHSCEPNAGIKGQIILIAMRDIAAGEEVAFDYATVLCGDADRVLADYSFVCTCGKAGCRGTVTAHDWKRPDLRRKYRGWFSWYLQEMIDRESGNEDS